MARATGGPVHPRRAQGTNAKIAPPQHIPLTAQADRIIVADIPVDDLDAARLERLRGLQVKVRQPAVAELVRECAARVQASVPYRSEGTDRDGFTCVVQLLVAYYYDSGRVDPIRALRRTNVDAYLTSRKRPTRRTIRYLLYAAGRVFAAQEFPPAQILDAPRQTRTTAATPEEITALYRVAVTLGDKWQPALTLLLDLIYGTGARPQELKHLRRSDVRVEHLHGVRWVVVTLQTPSTQPREVPVLDPETADRIERYVGSAPHEHLLAFGRTPTVERNAVNRVNDRLAERRQPERIDSKAVRHAWMTRIARLVRIDQFCYLAGLRTLEHIRDLELIGPTTADLAGITASLTGGDVQ